MTFKIDKVGFYKNRKGETVKITRKGGRGWLDNKLLSYTDFGKVYPEFTTEHDLIECVAHWEEPTVGYFTDANIAVNPNPNTTMAIGTNSKASKVEPLKLEEFYIVWDNKTQEPYGEYDTLEQAKSSAQRAAKEYSGETFYVMKAIAAYTAEVEVKEIKI